jgi:hypothetical protein
VTTTEATTTTTTAEAGAVRTPAKTDATPPDTRIVAGPGRTTAAHRVAVRFRATERSTFQCRLDRGRWQSCRSPKTYASLKHGSHRVFVRATDAAGNIDPTPAWRVFRVR